MAAAPIHRFVATGTTSAPENPWLIRLRAMMRPTDDADPETIRLLDAAERALAGVVAVSKDGELLTGDMLAADGEPRP